MIEIVVDKERNLKNLTQIGTPREEEKIYVENTAYCKIKEESYKEKRVFVLMGHTERMDGRYATFVEAAIPVREVEFAGNVPQWNNSMWSNVFREIKKVYEDMIIVGWALDIKGMSPRMTPELERVHREHFGGVHQLLFLIDSLEQEENFYMYKENKLVPKEGFYIYYRAQKTENSKTDIDSAKRPQQEDEKLIKLDILGGEEDIEEWGIQKTPVRGRYRAMMQEQEQKPKENGNTALAIAMAMLVFVLGVGAYENKDVLFGQSRPTAIETQSESDTDTQTQVDAEVSTEKEGEVEKIPVEIIPGTEN